MEEHQNPMKRLKIAKVVVNMAVGASGEKLAKAAQVLERALAAVDFKIKKSSFDEFGNFSFGIKEHISLPGVKYDPALGIFGFDVCVTIERPGYRVMRRRRKRSSVGKDHRVTREEGMKFVEEVLGVKIT
jgi:large subunit ribosomal protein L5